MDVEFVLNMGEAITNHNGIRYCIGGQCIWDTDVLYGPQYWGTYPLYTGGALIVTGVFITYDGGSASVRAQLVTESHVINLDGSSGMQQKVPDTYNLILQSGETLTIDASFTMLPNIENRLNRFVAELCLPDGRVLMSEGVYCPTPVD
jgi:hypothetical protein